MNIETLYSYVLEFENYVITSGFHRDINDLTTSMPNYQNDILNMRKVIENLNSYLENIYRTDLPAHLIKLMIHNTQPSFTFEDHYKNLIDLYEDKKIPQNQFFTKLTDIINKLNGRVNQNVTEVSRIKKFLEPYVDKDTQQLKSTNSALISIIFNDELTTKSLTTFSKTIHCWNKYLPLYHQLLRSESPEDIEIVEIQNGSIDIVFNLDIKVAMGLAEVFKVGMGCFAAYLAYKEVLKPFTSTFRGNKKLINAETDMEEGMLENIGTALQEKIQEQHTAALKMDSSIDKSSVKIKVNEVEKLISSHIVKGNEFKLLAVPELDENNDEDQATIDEINSDLEKLRVDIKNKSKLLSMEEKMLLSTTYEVPKNEIPIKVEDSNNKKHKEKKRDN